MIEMTVVVGIACLLLGGLIGGGFKSREERKRREVEQNDIRYALAKIGQHDSGELRKVVKNLKA